MPSTSRIAAIPPLTAPRRPATGRASRARIPAVATPSLDSAMTGDSTTATIAPPIGPTMSRKRIACQAITVSPTRISASDGSEPMAREGEGRQDPDDHESKQQPAEDAAQVGGEPLHHVPLQRGDPHRVERVGVEGERRWG